MINLAANSPTYLFVLIIYYLHRGRVASCMNAKTVTLKNIKIMYNISIKGDIQTSKQVILVQSSCVSITSRIAKQKKC